MALTLACGFTLLTTALRAGWWTLWLTAPAAVVMFVVGMIGGSVLARVVWDYVNRPKPPR
jgi:hypothetical protein